MNINFNGVQHIKYHKKKLYFIVENLIKRMENIFQQEVLMVMKQKYLIQQVKILLVQEIFPKKFSVVIFPNQINILQLQGEMDTV